MHKHGGKVELHKIIPHFKIKAWIHKHLNCDGTKRHSKLRYNKIYRQQHNAKQCRYKYWLQKSKVDADDCWPPSRWRRLFSLHHSHQELPPDSSLQQPLWQLWCFGRWNHTTSSRPGVLMLFQHARLPSQNNQSDNIINYAYFFSIIEFTLMTCTESSQPPMCSLDCPNKWDFSSFPFLFLSLFSTGDWQMRQMYFKNITVGEKKSCSHSVSKNVFFPTRFNTLF